jgi:hypothetical protein
MEWLDINALLGFFVFIFLLIPIHFVVLLFGLLCQLGGVAKHFVSSFATAVFNNVFTSFLSGLLYQLGGVTENVMSSLASSNKQSTKTPQKIQSVSTNATQADALKALIRAADFQRKRADALKKKVKSQEKKITTLNALCESLLDNKEQSLIAQSELKEETEELSLTITSLQRRLRKSDSYNDELKLKLEEVVTRASRLETEGNEKSRSMLRLEELLLASYAENEKIQNDLEGCIAQMSDSVLEVYSPSKVVPQDHYNLQDESKRREEEDKATILQLQTAISTMKVSHERAEKLSESKINILIEMKLALEEQVRLLESK